MKPQLVWYLLCRPSWSWTHTNSLESARIKSMCQYSWLCGVQTICSFRHTVGIRVMASLKSTRKGCEPQNCWVWEKGKGRERQHQTVNGTSSPAFTASLMPWVLRGTFLEYSFWRQLPKLSYLAGNRTSIWRLLTESKRGLVTVRLPSRASFRLKMRQDFKSRDCLIHQIQIYTYHQVNISTSFSSN